MKPELKARLARLGPIRDVDHVSSGSPATLVLRPSNGLAKVRTIDAIRALARRGMTLLRAKRAVEAMVEDGSALAHVPMVDDASALSSELKKAGVEVRRVSTAPVDVKAIRSALGLSQEQFARRYALDLDAVQNWEQGRCMPDKPAQAYLRAIAAAPREVAASQEEPIS